MLKQHLLYLLYKFTIYAKSNHEKQRGILSGLSKYHAQNMVLRVVYRNTTLRTWYYVIYHKTISIFRI